MEISEKSSDRFDPASPMGTKKWWDYQLAHSWELNGGPEQSKYFMQALLEHLPTSEQSYLRTNALSILDCGCATGEGVALLGQAFPSCRVAGLDIAQSAIETAQERYPQHEFILTDNGEIPQPFDVILTSNVLEHFEDPLAMAQQQAMNSRLLYLILVPYYEYPHTDGHLVTFTENSFPDFLGGLVRLSVTPFDADAQVWAGKQVLVVYASQAYLRARQLEAGALSSEQEQRWDTYFQSPPQLRALLEELAVRCAQSETALNEVVFARKFGPLGKMEKLIQLRDRLAPDGTRRRRWLARGAAWALSKN